MVSRGTSFSCCIVKCIVRNMVAAALIRHSYHMLSSLQVSQSQDHGITWFIWVVGPPLIEGRGVFVVFWSLCIGFYSISCFSRRAYGPFFNLFFSHFSVFLLRSELSSQSLTRSWCYVVNFLLGGVLGGVGGGSGGGDNVLLLAFLLTSFCWCYVVNFLLGIFTRSWCYVVNFLLRVLHALDATLWTFFLEFLHALDATLWTFFSEFYTLLMLRCELSSWKFTRSWCYVVNFLLRVLHALDATLWTFFLEVYTLLMLRCELSSQSFARSWCYVVNCLLGSPQPNRWISPSKAYVISKKFSWSQGKR